MRVLIPITLDRWRHSIATVLRETCVRIPDVSFYSFSNPATQEDRVLGEQVWALSNMHSISVSNAIGEAFDVVHHGSATNRNIAASLLARVRAWGGCRHLYTASVEPSRRDPWYWHYRFCVRIADKLTAVSSTVANSVKREFGRGVDAVIPNGVDLDFFAPAAAQAVDFESLGIRPPFVIFVGHLELRKRPDVFIELSRLVPELDFVMLGEQSRVPTRERNTYLAQIRTRRNLKYLGSQPRALVRDLYAGALALIFPSEIEGLPLAVREAQAMGLPVLAQPKTCMPEIIEEDRTGWLLPVENLGLWAAKLRELLRWPDHLRQTFSENARKSTGQNYSWDVIAPLYRDIYFATQHG